MGQYIIFPNGYNHPLGSGRFPNNTYFQITRLDGLSAGDDIEWTSTFINTATGSLVTYTQGFAQGHPSYPKGTFWDSYNRSDAKIDLGLGLVANGRNKIITIGNWVNNGVPLVGRFFVSKVPITLSGGTTLPVGKYQIVSQSGGTFQIIY